METIEEALDRVLGVLPSNFLSKYLRRLKTPSVPKNRKIMLMHYAPETFKM